MRIDRPAWARIEPHFDQALELEPRQREVWLTQLSTTHPDIAEAVRDLLAKCAALEASGFMRDPVFATTLLPALHSMVTKQGRSDVESSLDAAARRATDLKASTIIGPYRLLHQIGAGGMSSVWLAERCDDQPHREVALKLPFLGVRMQAERFRRECELLATLTHSNIARLYDTGITESGQPYLAMEYVAGSDLLQYCDERRLTVHERLELFLQVLEAVQFAHSQLVIHRDLKPSNILVTAAGRVVLIDFGIGKLLTEGSMDVTQFGRAFTPDYASPEQITGMPLGAASDIYSLGVILYELLSGVRPHRSKRESAAALEAAILADDVHRPSQSSQSAESATSRGTSLRTLARTLSGDLDTVVLKCLKLDATERYPSVSAFAQDISNYLHSLPISARPDSFRYRSSKFVRRHRKAIAVGVMLLIAIIAGAAGTLVQAQRAQARAREAEQERDLSAQLFRYARSGNELMTFLLQESAGAPITADVLLSRTGPLIAKQFAHDPEVQAYLQLTVAEQYAQAGYQDQAAELLRQAAANRASIKDSVLVAEIDCQMGQQHSVNGEYAEGQRLLDGAIATLRAQPVPNSLLLANCLQSRGELHAARSNGSAALKDAKEALSLLDTTNSIELAQVVITRATLAKSLELSGQRTAAIEQYRLALNDLARIGRDDSRLAVGLYNNYGVLLSQGGQSLAALETYERADALAQGFGQIQPALVSNHAFSLLDVGRAKEAVALLERALAEAKRQGDPRTVTLLKVRGARAWCFTGDVARCTELLKSARTEMPGLLPQGHPRFGTLEVEEARVALDRGDRNGARAHLQRAIDLFARATSASSYQIQALALMARVEIDAGALDSAAGYVDQALSKARAALAGFEHSSWLGQALLSRALLEHARAEHQRAHATLQSALTEFDATMGAAAPPAVEVRKLLGEWPTS